ncbi:MAG: protein kinase [Leptolyngbya sp. SIO3F4]|nr:protein kinase [Leptolyngbya sp. SIO3F4]
MDIRQNDWSIGKKIKEGEYTITRRLGSGGCGVTYLVCDQQDNLFAIKAIEVVDPLDEILKMDISSEVDLLRSLDHPHIARFHDFFVELGKTYCIVMEYVEGSDLSQLVSPEQMMSEEEAVTCAFQIGEALAYAHQKNTLHRDVKPGNIIKCKEGVKFVLIDFGISRKFKQDQIIQNTIVRGTPAFMPPEQDRSLFQKRGTYTDVYGISATLYNLVTGVAPPSWSDRDKEIKASGRDPLQTSKHPRVLNAKVSSIVSDAIISGMRLSHQERSQSVVKWLSLFHKSHEQTKSTLKVPGIRKLEFTINGSSTEGSKIFIQRACFLLAIILFLGVLYRSVNYSSQETELSSGNSSISSIGELRYERLNELLNNGDFIEADKETYTLLLNLANRKRRTGFISSNIKTIPCDALLEIDGLWMQYSDGKFGFSVQSAIWQEVGGNPDEYDENIADQMGDLVRWRVDGRWNEAIVSNATMFTRGTLPHIANVRTLNLGVPYFSQRISDCNTLDSSDNE